MTSVVSSTCRVMGMKALKQDRIGTAMAWGLKSQVSMNKKYYPNGVINWVDYNVKLQNFGYEPLNKNLFL